MPPLSVSKNYVIVSQCAHWRDNPYPLQGGALRVPSAHRRPFGVVLLYERQRERIATPACGLVRDDIYILGFFYSLRAAYQSRPEIYHPGAAAPKASPGGEAVAAARR